MLTPHERVAFARETELPVEIEVRPLEAAFYGCALSASLLSQNPVAPEINKHKCKWGQFEVEVMVGPGKTNTDDNEGFPFTCEAIRDRRVTESPVINVAANADLQRTWNCDVLSTEGLLCMVTLGAHLAVEEKELSLVTCRFGRHRSVLGCAALALGWYSMQGSGGPEGNFLLCLERIYRDLVAKQQIGNGRLTLRYLSELASLTISNSF